MMTLKEAVKKIRPLDEKAMEGAKKRWDSIAKPLHSLGELENMLTQIAGITGTPDVRVEKKAVVAMCADRNCGREFSGRNHNLLCNVPSVRSGAVSCGCWNGNGHKSTYRS